MSGKTYVLSDLHGHYQILLSMLEKINFTDEDTLYILGDCCDRGPKSLEIYFYLQKHHNIHLIKGNNEIMMRVGFVKIDTSSSMARMWSRNGGNKTIENYHAYISRGCLNIEDYEIVKAAFYRTMVNYINSCPSFVELTINNQNYVLIHAGINPEKTLYEQTEEECAWMREYFYMSPALENKTIIFGHTPTCYIHQTEYQCFDIWKDPIYHDKIGIDGGLAIEGKGQLNCICLDTMEVYAIQKQDALDTL